MHFAHYTATELPLVPGLGIWNVGRGNNELGTLGRAVNKIKHRNHHYMK